MLISNLLLCATHEEVLSIKAQTKYTYDIIHKGYLKSSTKANKHHAIYKDVMGMEIEKLNKSHDFQYNTFISHIYEYKSGLKIVAFMDDTAMAFVVLGFNDKNELREILEIKAPLKLLVMYLSFTNGKLINTY